MGKIIASYLVKVHLHAPADVPTDEPDAVIVPTNESVKATIIDKLSEDIGLETTVSLIERTDD